jgi:hypothetical protein
MKYNKKLDNVLFIIMMLLALTCAVIAFVSTTVNHWAAGIWVLSCALGFWLSKRLQADRETLIDKNNDLNRLYQDTMAEKLNYRQEKEDLVQEVLRLEGEVAARDRKIQELSDQVQIEGMKELEPEPVQQPEGKALDDVKATLLKVKKRSRKKQ